MIIDFPPEFNLLASSPDVGITYPNFASCATAAISHYYSSAKVTIENIKSYLKDTDFVISVSGFKNPDTPNVFSTWTVSSLLSNKLINTNVNFAAYS